MEAVYKPVRMNWQRDLESDRRNDLLADVDVSTIREMTGHMTCQTKGMIGEITGKTTGAL